MVAAAEIAVAIMVAMVDPAAVEVVVVIVLQEETVLLPKDMLGEHLEPQGAEQVIPVAVEVVLLLLVLPLQILEVMVEMVVQVFRLIF